MFAYFIHKRHHHQYGGDSSVFMSVVQRIWEVLVARVFHQLSLILHHVIEKRLSEHPVFLHFRFELCQHREHTYADHAIIFVASVKKYKNVFGYLSES